MREVQSAESIYRANSIPHNGIIRYLGILNTERLVIISPKALSEVLTTKSYDFVKPLQVRRGLGKLLGVGVLLAEGDEHKTQRKNLMPAFTFRHVKDLYPVFWGKAREAVQAMTAALKTDEHTAAAKDAVLEVGGWASRATLDIIGVAGMGQDFGAIQNPDAVLSRTYATVFKPSRQAQLLGTLNLFLPEWFVKRIPLKRNGEIEEAAATIRDVCRKLIRAKKESLEKNQLTDVDILSVALESGGFTEENLVDQMMTFLAAGHETTATSMIWAIYMLCLNPDVQTRLRQEVREKLPSIEDNTQITSQDIDHMPYLNAVCNEVLRYYPPVPLTFRETARDTTIIGQFVPKGTRVMLVPWACNRNQEQWGPDTDKFNPERWMASEDNPRSANGGATSNYAFMTFLHGPRSCIGSGFAKSEFACLLAAWIGRFEFALNDERLYDEKNLVIKGAATAKIHGGLYVKTKIIEGW
jgi:cytochrome P450